MSDHIEIHHREWMTGKGRELSSVGLRALETGDLQIDKYDLGPAAEELWGDCDREEFLTIPAADVPKLIPHIFTRAFADGEPLTFDGLEILCREAGIKAWCFAWTRAALSVASPSETRNRETHEWIISMKRSFSACCSTQARNLT